MMWLAFVIAFYALALAGIVLMRRSTVLGEQMTFAVCGIAGVVLSAYSLLAFVNAHGI